MNDAVLKQEGAVLKKILREDTGVFSLIIEFNFLLIRYLHEAWLDTVPDAGIYRELRKNRRVHWALSSQLLSRFGLADSFVFDFRELPVRLMLLDAGSLKTLMRYLGLVQWSTSIAQMILEADKRQLIETLGSENYLFTVKEAPFLKGSDALVSPGSLDPEQAEIQIMESGKRVLEALFSTVPSALGKRFTLKYPPGENWTFQGEPEQQEYTLWVTCTESILRRKMNEQWQKIHLS